MTPFVVFSLPRCRSFWLSKFLTYGGRQCGHSELRHCRSLDDVRSWFAQPGAGSVEQVAAPFWRLLERVAPGARVVTVRRPLEAVAASFARAGVVFDPELVRPVHERLERKLDQIEARLPDVLSVTFEQLAEESVCAQVFTHCLEIPHDHAWWEQLAPMNLQVCQLHFLQYLQAYGPQMEKLRRVARQEMLRTLARPVEPEPGVTFQQESLYQAFNDPDGQRLMSEECAMLGQYPEAWLEMNLPLFERLEAMGNLHIYTARMNGRMFGYLVTAIGEAFHKRNQWEADQVSFFADPTWPGLGRKLQYASIDDLRRQGINRVMMFQPDGTRLGLLYRRLGAQQTGQRFVLELQ